MILTVNIHPTAIKVARSGQGGRNVALEMTDATGGTVASIFPGDADGWDRLVSLAIEGRAMQEQADTGHAIAGDLDEQTADSDRCPSCESPQPGMHPATQADGGEVLYICPDPWHTTDEQIRRDGEALGRRIAADEGIEPEQLYVVVNVEPDGRRVTVSDPRPKALAEQWAQHEAKFYAGTLEVAPARPEDLDDADGAS